MDPLLSSDVRKTKGIFQKDYLPLKSRVLKAIMADPVPESPQRVEQLEVNFFCGILVGRQLKQTLKKIDRECGGSAEVAQA